MRTTLLALSMTLWSSVAGAQASSAAYPSAPVASSRFPAGKSETINIVQWNADQLPKVFQRSEQLPLTDLEVAKLSRAGFEPQQIVKMLEERRCACDASADGLIMLKKQGVSPEVLSAVSLHALKPNRSLTILVTVDFIGPAVPADGSSRGAAAVEAAGGVPRDSFLYFFVDDGPLTRSFTADAAALLQHRATHTPMVDRSDLLLTKGVRRIELVGEVPLKSYGEHSLFVTSAARPSINHPGLLSDTERDRGQAYHFEYPRSSLQSLCRLWVG
ncbi:MAG: hypothetical protein HY901_00575, partial [Deltaproteobacteria bacterium]|nr:hypothetical protein [Deltaproteobacteria bacterium]